MSNTKIDPKKIDQIAELEVDAILEGLKDSELKKNPAFLEKVRKFLSQNDFKTTPETLSNAFEKHMDIPVFDGEPKAN